MNHHDTVVKKINETIDRANSTFGLNMPYPTVKFDLRGTTAGTANHATNVVRINEGLLVRNFEAFLNDTCVHEVAHLVTYKLHDASRHWTGKKWVRTIQPHGNEWQQVMRTLGCNPSRCHSFDVSETKIKRNVTTYTYHCACCEHEISTRTHHSIQSGRGRFCKKCRVSLKVGPLVFRTTTPIPTVPAFMIPPAVRTARPVVRSAAPAPAPNSVPNIGSKKDRAEALYRAHKATADRATIIALFVSELDMTTAGASTYYANCKKSFS